MTTELALGGTKLTVRVARLLARCPHFEEPLLYQVRSPVRVDVFRVFVAALEGTPSVVTTENMNDLFFLCDEFGFTSLLSLVPDFISSHPVLDSEGPKRAADITEERLQIKEALYPMQEALSGV
jgi:hypothetical protein